MSKSSSSAAMPSHVHVWLKKDGHWPIDNTPLTVEVKEGETYASIGKREMKAAHAEEATVTRTDSKICEWESHPTD